MPVLHERLDGRLIVKTSYPTWHGNEVVGEYATLQVSDTARALLKRHGISNDGDQIPWELYYDLIGRRLIASMQEIRKLYLTDRAGANLNDDLGELASSLWRRYAHCYRSDQSPLTNFCAALERMCEQQVSDPRLREAIRQFLDQVRRRGHE